MTSFRFTTAGESHGPGLVAIVEGMPAGLELDREALDRDMARRQLGHGRGGRMKIETDTVEIRSGLRHGRTLGSPIAVLVANRDYANWEERMNPWPVEGFEPDEVHLPRPGHADLVGAQKYGHTDIRNVLERASARETAARVAAGSLARGFLSALGVSVHSHVIQIASVKAPERPDLGPEDFAAVDEDPVRCLDPDASAAMVEEINRLRKANESLGGSFEVRAFGLVPGLGSHISWEDRLDGRLAGAVASIQSVKGVAIGEAWDVAGLLPRDQPRRRSRGRDDQRAAALGAGRDQADLDPDQAAALGRHRDQGAGAGAARAHRLHRRPRRRGRRRGDGLPRPGPLLPREVRRRPHRRRAGRRRRLQEAHRLQRVSS
jgi:chorismate synthase